MDEGVWQGTDDWAPGVPQMPSRDWDDADTGMRTNAEERLSSNIAYLRTQRTPEVPQPSAVSAAVGDWDDGVADVPFRDWDDGVADPAVDVDDWDTSIGGQAVQAATVTAPAPARRKISLGSGRWNRASRGAGNGMG